MAPSGLQLFAINNVHLFVGTVGIHLPTDYRRRATRSDFWLAYAGAFPARIHRFCGKEEGETNHAERWFGSLRARASRLVRRAYSFSKRIERHLDALHLFIVTHNLRIKQSTPR